MNRAAALGVLALLAGLTAAALLAPWPIAVALALVAPFAMRGGRRAYLTLAATAVPINVVLLAWVADDWRAGAATGAIGAARMLGALGANLAVLSWAGPARTLEGLRMPPRLTATLAAILLAAQDVGRDFARLRDARRLDGSWPDGRLARAREAARLAGPLVLAAHRRATARRDALRLAGHGMPPWFVPVVAVAALAAAGRMAFLALPNVALTYVVAFLGGLLFGPLIGASGAFLGMLLTDLMLTGVYPPALVNAPAMGLVGLVGGALRRADLVGSTREARLAGRMLVASLGLACTFLFSLAADSLTWLMLYRHEPAALTPMLLAGLAFNVLPALTNAALFAASVAPTLRAWRAAHAPAPPRARAPAAAPERGPPEPADPPAA